MTQVHKERGLRLHDIMHWNLLVALQIIWIEVLVDALALPHIHWNSSNPMFKSSTNDLTIKVHMGDQIDFVCPFSTDQKNIDFHEYYIIYEVAEDEYKNCYLHPDRKYNMVVNCSDPIKRKRFTIIFEKYSPNPNGRDFKHGQAYYYISTSTGSKDGMNNLQRGACTDTNLKLVFQVCCESAIKATTTSPNPNHPPIKKDKATQSPFLSDDNDVKSSKTGRKSKHKKRNEKRRKSSQSSHNDTLSEEADNNKKARRRARLKKKRARKKELERRKIKRYHRKTYNVDESDRDLKSKRRIKSKKDVAFMSAQDWWAEVKKEYEKARQNRKKRRLNHKSKGRHR